MYLQKRWPKEDDPENTRIFFSVYPVDFVDLSKEDYKKYIDMFKTNTPREIDFWLRRKQATFPTQ